MKQIYTILIVEDEDIVREGLVETIPWEEMGFRVVSQAANGKEALSKFRSKPTDVVLTDIRMPEVDGVALLRAIKEQSPSTQVIFISSYAEFEYAQRAIEYKAFSYIIKTELFDELEKVLLELYAFLDRQRCSRAQEASQRRARESQQLFKGIQTGSWEAAPRGPWYQIVAVPRSSAGTVSVPENEEKNLLYGTSEKGDMIFLLSEAEEETLSFAIQKLFRRLFAGGQGILAAGGSKREQGEIGRSYYEAMKTIDILPGSSRGIYLYRELEKDLEPWQNKERWSTETMVRLLTNGKTEEFLGEMKQYISGCAHMRDMYIYDCRAHISSIFSRAADIYGGALREIYHSVLQRFAQYDHFPALLTAVEEASLQVEEALCRMKRKNEDEMQQILNFVQVNFRSDLRLQDIAEHFYLSVPYLSALFKKHVGMTFTNYLREYRLRWAAHLLETTRFNVQKISSEVGYLDSRYFVRLFSEAYGMTPSEYRARLKEKNI